MPVDLSIKNVPDDVAEKLRERAKKNHRSLQGELMSLIENSLTTNERISPAELHARVERSGFTTPGDSVDIIRADRDSR